MRAWIEMCSNDPTATRRLWSTIFEPLSATMNCLSHVYYLTLGDFILYWCGALWGQAPAKQMVLLFTYVLCPSDETWLHSVFA